MDWIAGLILFLIKEWWAHVTDTPDANKIAVLSRGIWKGFRGKIYIGGQHDPISILGAKLLWKYAQKKAKKKQTSEIINSIIPHHNPL